MLSVDIQAVSGSDSDEPEIVLKMNTKINTEDRKQKNTFMKNVID